ncbi:hypothetical protein N7454_000020 [Penicillium verhagenii]|nr:hypothetical protein N7454_000020 [Penicillium verhagenii]
MSGLDPVTSGLGRIPINKTTETATKPTKSIPKLDRPVKQVQKQTKDITDPIIPGEFPRDEGAPRTQHEPTPPQLSQASGTTLPGGSRISCLRRWTDSRAS